MEDGDKHMGWGRVWGLHVADCGLARIGGGRELLELVWVTCHLVYPTLMRCVGEWGLIRLRSIRVCMTAQLSVCTGCVCVGVWYVPW